MVAVLREADRTSVAETAKKTKISEQTIYAWRKHFGELSPQDIKRLRALEGENVRLKKLLALGLSETAEAQPKPLKPVTIAVGTTVLNVTYPWLTLPVALGYWRDEGYEVKIVTVGGSLQAIQQMVAGTVDFSQVLLGPLIQANTENNVPVRGIMGTAVMDWGVGVLPNGPIKSVADLKGKKIGTFSLGTGGIPMLKAYLRSNGINPDTDVEIIATGAGAPALEALKSGRVQAIALWGAALASFENAGTKLDILYDPRGAACRTSHSPPFRRPSIRTLQWSKPSHAGPQRQRYSR